ncbi:carbohydrate ABC transporter permease [Acidaminobacter sp. JC074]|uniref:carbohydrate ABC transporter permease n=1 Tax=Acidaminobacter sp. JC074 TaxID=2530199 RepID=UPI001F0F4880|nr:carbohydrate ABC transporter permease [Acidaminobacter sp. JC074]MCH4888978.1 carbohydrate ABC transporter permease [Acidaminobacter sp. JC074]
MKKNYRIWIYLSLVIAIIATIGPFIWMFLTSIKTYEEAIKIPPSILPEITQWINYKIVLDKFPFIQLYFNTFVVVLGVVVGQIIVSSLAAYAFARLEFPFKKILFVIVLSLLMIPGQIFLIPHYNIMIALKSTNTLRALIIPGLFNVFGVFLLRQFFMGIPKELDEAAMIDGCNRFQIYYKIIMPLAKPGLVALAIVTSLNTWKSLMWPIIVNRSMEKMTLSAGLAFLIGEHTTYYEQVMAGAVISVLPMIVIFIFFQKQIVEGIASTGIKG